MTKGESNLEYGHALKTVAWCFKIVDTCTARGIQRDDFEDECQKRMDNLVITFGAEKILDSLEKFFPTNPKMRTLLAEECMKRIQSSNDGQHVTPNGGFR